MVNLVSDEEGVTLEEDFLAVFLELQNKIVADEKYNILLHASMMFFLGLKSESCLIFRRQHMRRYWQWLTLTGISGLWFQINE